MSIAFPQARAVGHGFSASPGSRPSAESYGGAEKLLAVALGMGLKSLDEIRDLAKGEKEASVRIAAVHALFAAPMIAAANRLKMPGTTLTSFGYQEAGIFVPRPSMLDPDNQREIVHTAPSSSVVSPLVDERLDSAVKREPWREKVTRFCTALEIDSLWQKDEIDLAVVSREVFKNHLGPQASREGIVVGTISQSARAANLIVLIYPDRSQGGGALARGRAKTKRATSDSTPTGAELLQLRDLELLRACGRKLKVNELRVMCPSGTVGTLQIKRLMSIYQWLNGESLLVDDPHNLSEFDAFRDRAFERARAQGEGVALLALWEPFATFIRRAWDDFVAADAPALYKAMSSTSQQGGVGRWQGASEPFHCSVDLPLARLFNIAEVPFNPLFPVDVIATRTFLNKGPAARMALAKIFDALQAEIVKLREAADLYTDITVQSHMSPDPESRARFVGSWLITHATDTVFFLSSAFGLSIPQTFRALCELEFALTFDRSFVNYLLNNDHPSP